MGIVGCGLVVERGYLPALDGIGELRLVAVADPLAERRSIATGATGYPDLDAMLAGEQLDAVVICSPPEQHLRHAQACASAGIPSLVEKPPGVTLEQARSLAALQPEPAIGFNRRFARGLPIGSRAIDKPARLTAIFDAPPLDWQRPGPPADVLLDLGCHLVDLACWISGSHPVRSRAVSVAADRAAFELELASGARLYAECGAASRYRELLEIRSEDGAVRTWRWPPSGTAHVADRLARRPAALVASWQAQLRAFAELLRGGRPARLARARDGVDVLAALEAVAGSAATGNGWVTVPGDPRQSGARAG